MKKELLFMAALARQLGLRTVVITDEELVRAERELSCLSSFNLSEARFTFEFTDLQQELLGGES